MPDMNGAKLSLTNAETGQVVDYEIVRVGTMKEYRRLRKESETHEQKSKTQAKEMQTLAVQAAGAKSRASDLEAELTALRESIAKRKARAASLFAKLDGGKSVIAQTVEEMLGVIGEIHE